MTETCFSRCIDNMYSRTLDDNEAECVEDCSSKFVKFNHKLMQNFVIAQTEIVSKRIADAEQQQAVLNSQSQLQNSEANQPSAENIGSVSVQNQNESSRELLPENTNSEITTVS